jgi:prepilin-type N-terminal cleavage/methylation domain-containing protein
MMKKRTAFHCDQRGFTLLEVIITLVIAAIFGSMLIQFTGTSMSRSADTVERVRNGSTLVRTVEEITKDYRKWIKSNPDDPLVNFKNMIDADASYGCGNIAVRTVFSDVDSGMDTDIEILWVTVSELDEDLNARQSLVTLFTR